MPTALRHLILTGLILCHWSPLCPAQDSAPVSETSAPVKVEDRTSDQAIRNRILSIFSEVEEYRPIQISAKSGVVTLSGEVKNARIKEEAFQLVRRTEGVVLTVDRLTLPDDVTSQLAPTIKKMREMWQKFLIKLPLVGVALGVIIVFWTLGSLVARQQRWFFGRLPMSSLGLELVHHVLRLGLTILGFVIALEILDATAIVSAVLGAAGLAGLAIGFAFKSIAENYLAGILLSTRNPFEIGDVIDIAGDRGKVARLTSRDTVLVTLDGNHLRIPNSIVMNSRLLNFSRNPLRRFEFTVTVSAQCDLSEVRTLALGILSQNPGVLGDPEASLVIDSLNENRVVLKILAWVDQTKHDFVKTRSESIRLVKEALGNAGCELPDTTLKLWVDPESPLRDWAAPRHENTPQPSPVTSPQRKTPTAVSEEELAADCSIDEQIEAESQQSNERNLLEDSPKSKT